MGQFIYKLKRVKLQDLLQVWKLPFALVLAVFYRLKHKNLWIVCEDKNEARDNGYWFFKYLKTEHPEQECVYAISSSSPDFFKVESIGDWVEFGSLKHWILYFAADKKISSQKAGNPNAAIFYLLEVYGIIKDTRIFLGHGVTINNAKWLYYDVTKMKRFVCGAYPEYEYVKENFGYPNENIVYTGLCRFDGLHNFAVNKKQILIMPTWREWIADEDSRLLEYEGTTIVPETEYFKKWISLLSNERLYEVLKKNNKNLVFYPHRNMQKYIEYFPKDSDRIRIANVGEYDVQELMKSSAMMITDYSSVFMDMLYMNKPVVFYQFDVEKFRKAQYDKGFFDYDNNPFAICCHEENDLIDNLNRIINDDFMVSDEYLDAHSHYFKLYDMDNCRRIYDMILGL